MFITCAMFCLTFFFWQLIRNVNSEQPTNDRTVVTIIIVLFDGSTDQIEHKAMSITINRAGFWPNEYYFVKQFCVHVSVACCSLVLFVIWTVSPIPCTSIVALNAYSIFRAHYLKIHFLYWRIRKELMFLIQRNKYKFEASKRTDEKCEIGLFVWKLSKYGAAMSDRDNGNRNITNSSSSTQYPTTSYNT